MARLTPLTIPDDPPPTPPTWTFVQGWDHGPIWVARPDGIGAVCTECGWAGPERTGDPAGPVVAARLAVDDAVEHMHAVGVPCRLCEACIQQVEARYAGLDEFKAQP